MSSLGAAVAEAKAHLTEQLRSLGWDVADDGSISGEITRLAPPHQQVAVRFDESFPFKPPAVLPWDGSGSRSWHQNADGSLCLYSPSDSGDLAWMDAGALVCRIEEWFDKDTAGWPGDPLDLDLERYFEPTEGLAIYDDVERLVGTTISFHGRSGAIYTVRPGGPPRKGRDVYRQGWAGDLGELDRPVRDWDEIAERIGGRAKGILDRIRRGEVTVLLLRYTRGGVEGVLALRVTATKNPAKPPSLWAMTAAKSDEATLRLRSGPHAAVLRERSVAIVGVGAVGSFLADLLARGGIGKLTLVDGDRLRPGNSVRHFVFEDRYWGSNKAKAVADILARNYGTDAVADPAALTTPTAAERLFADHDLVIDATANGWTQELIAQAATHANTPALTVYLQRDGGVARIDRWPREANAEHADPVPALQRDPASELREGGCGDAVSPAPPWTALGAASRAAHLAEQLLVGGDVPVTVIDVLHSQPDPPYDRLGIV